MTVRHNSVSIISFNELNSDSASWFCHVSSSVWYKSTFSHFYSGMVYEDAERIYAHVKKEAQELLEDASQKLMPNSIPFSMTYPLQTSTNGKIVAYNTTPFRYLAVIEVPLNGAAGNRLKAEIVQINRKGNSGLVLIDASKPCSPAFSRGLFADMPSTFGMSFTRNTEFFDVHVCIQPKKHLRMSSSYRIHDLSWRLQMGVSLVFLISNKGTQPLFGGRVQPWQLTAENLLPPIKLEAWSYTTIDQIIGMHGVRWINKPSLIHSYV